MARSRHSTFIAALLVVAVTMGGWVANFVDARSPDYLYEIKRNIDLFGRVYEEISKRYVEEIDPQQFMKAGIHGMLKTLDPYTVLMEQEDNAELQIMSTGKYGGVGMRIGQRDGWPTVVEPPFANSPSLRAGIREGDQIIEVDGKGTKGESISETAGRLRGKVGTDVTIKVRRQGERTPLEFNLFRAEISVKDVVYAGFVRDGVGYIRLRAFSQNAGREMHAAIQRLKSEGMKSLIFDVRDNPGGLLDAAVEVSDNFLPKGKLIVSTKGRTDDAPQKLFARRSMTLGDMPLVVLVNGYSASASEIVAGAVQDWDRGVIIGSQTYGKGLVQTYVRLNRQAALKITTSKYYVPSGRLIQKPDVFSRSNYKVFEHKNGLAPSDTSIKNDKYETAGGRAVFGGGGITPDIGVKREKLTPFEFNLLAKAVFFNFAVRYAAEHSALPRSFEVTNDMVEAFRAHLEESEFEYKSRGEAELDKLQKIATEEKYGDAFLAKLGQVDDAFGDLKTRDFDRSIDFIRMNLQREIAAKLWGTEAEIETTFGHDPVIQKAIEVLTSPDSYAKILGNDTKG